MLSLGGQLRETGQRLAASEAACARLQNSVCTRLRELEGANAQIKAGRGHLKQLVADLEGEQERAAGLSAALDDARKRLAAAEGAQEVAEARLARAQKQVATASDSAGQLEAKAQVLETQLQVQFGA